VFTLLLDLDETLIHNVTHTEERHPNDISIQFNSDNKFNLNNPNTNLTNTNIRSRP